MPPAQPERAGAGLLPMMATARTALPPDREDSVWAYEFKWDGVRMICSVDDGAAVLTSRSARVITSTYPEVVAAVQALGRTLVLDGEVVALDPATGRPSFATLQQRMHLSRPADVDRVRAVVPISYLVFDLLALDGEWLLERPYGERRESLDGLGLQGAVLQTPPSFSGGGADVLAASRAGGLEGVVAKRRRSPYRPGRRSEEWLKVKNILTRDVIVGGWTPGKGRRDGGIGALMLGVPGGDGLRYVGNVGTGFSGKVLDALLDRLRGLVVPASPFVQVPRTQAREATWVRPELVGEVAYTEWTGDGRLRHPVWRGLRADIPAAEVEAL